MRKAFTIIEVLVSIVIFSLILTFLYATVNNLNLSNEFFKVKKAQFDEKEKLLQLLYFDISKAKEVQILNPIERKFSIVSIKETESIYGPSRANVLWFVHKSENTLLRIESYDEIKNNGVFIGNQQINVIELNNKCEIFKLYKQQNSTILYLKFEGKETESYFIN